MTMIVFGFVYVVSLSILRTFTPNVWKLLYCHFSIKTTKKSSKVNIYINVLVVVVVVYCVGYIILLCYLYYFNVLNAKIKLLILGVR